MDKRDDLTWVTLELSKSGEARAVDGTLSSCLRSLLHVDESFPVFVPCATYTKGGRTISVRLIEGYAFVATGLPETRYFSLEKSQMITRVFSSQNNGMRVLSVIQNEYVNSMKTQLMESMSADLEIGSEAHITGGNYRGLNGSIIDLYPESVAVMIKMRSMTVIALVPRNLVSPLDCYGGFSYPEHVFLEDVVGD